MCSAAHKACRLPSYANHSTDVADSPARDGATAALLRRVGWHILPLLLLLYFIAYLDRINIGFAAGSMQRDLGFSDSLYGTGAGVFFIGYLVAQVPSNMLLYRFGARRTIAALMLVWGCVAAGTAFVHAPATFLTLRFLLGIAEAGFYPGMILYLALWLPRRVRTSFTAWFVFAIPLANIFGGPVSTAILQHGRVGRFADWQMLLILEAMPAMIAGLLLPWMMTDSPSEAAWLSDDDRERLTAARTADEPPASQEIEPQGHRQRFGNPLHILRFAAVYFTMQVAQYSLSFWLPKILRSLHIAPKRIGWDVAIVFLIAGVGMLAWSRIADHSPISRWTLGVPLLVAAFAFALTAMPAVQDTSSRAGAWMLLAAFGLAAAAAISCTPAFWSLVTVGQKTAEFPTLIAVVNALGNLGGLAGPSLIGILEEHTHSHSAGLYMTSAGLLLGALMLYSAQLKSPEE